MDREDIDYFVEQLVDRLKLALSIDPGMELTELVDTLRQEVANQGVQIAKMHFTGDDDLQKTLTDLDHRLMVLEEDKAARSNHNAISQVMRGTRRV